MTQSRLRRWSGAARCSCWADYRGGSSSGGPLGRRSGRRSQPSSRPVPRCGPSERGRAELARVSGRAPGSGELTAGELRVARLIAAGLTNREAAAELFMTVRAVESTLAKIYVKLGVRSRTQLARQLHDLG